MRPSLVGLAAVAQQAPCTHEHIDLVMRSFDSTTAAGLVGLIQPPMNQIVSGFDSNKRDPMFVRALPKRSDPRVVFST